MNETERDGITSQASVESGKTDISEICDALARCFGSNSQARTPDEEYLGGVWFCIDFFKTKRPFRDMPALRSAEAQRLEDEAALAAAALALERAIGNNPGLAENLNKILIWEPEKHFPAEAQSIDNRLTALLKFRDLAPPGVGLRAVIAMLKAIPHHPEWHPFSLEDLPHRKSDKGQTTKEWVPMARRLAWETLAAFYAKGDQSRKIGRKNGPITNFVRWCLEQIMPGEYVPAAPTIYDAIENVELKTDQKPMGV